MSKLYVLGNGFDLESSLDTRYGDFKKWFENADPVSYGYFSNLFEIKTDSDWKHFEASLSNPFRERSALYELVLEVCSQEKAMDLVFDDPTGETTVIRIYEGLRSKFGTSPDNLYSTIFDTMIDRFSEWIAFVDSGIGLERVRSKKIRQLAFSPGYFLNFNYTCTLEEEYRIPQEAIFHIHGAVCADRGIVLGHDNDAASLFRCSNSLNPITRACCEVFGDAWFKSLKKTDEVIAQPPFVDFLDKLQQGNVKEVSVFGHSLCKQDLAYFKEIDDALKPLWSLYLRNVSYETKSSFFEITGISKSRCLIKPASDFPRLNS